MTTDVQLQTPFGQLTAYLSKYKGRYCVVFTGAVTINRVEYNSRCEFYSTDGQTWENGQHGSTTLDRRDRNDKAAYPFKAREKYTETARALLPFITSDLIRQCDEERRKADVEALQSEVASLSDKLRTAYASLHALQTPAEAKDYNDRQSGVTASARRIRTFLQDASKMSAADWQAVYDALNYIEDNGVQWTESALCDNCGEAAHVTFCPKPDAIPAEQWQAMTDDERLDAERSE